MKTHLRKTRHFRLDDTTESKLLAICESTRRTPSAAIRHLILTHPAGHDAVTPSACAPLQIAGERGHVN